MCHREAQVNKGICRTTVYQKVQSMGAFHPQHRWTSCNICLHGSMSDVHLKRRHVSLLKVKDADSDSDQDSCLVIQLAVCTQSC